MRLFYDKTSIIDKFRNGIIFIWKPAAYGTTLLLFKINSLYYYTAVRKITLVWLDKVVSLFSAFLQIHSSLIP